MKKVYFDVDYDKEHTPAFDAANYNLTHFNSAFLPADGNMSYTLEWENEDGKFFVVIGLLPDGSVRYNGDYSRAGRKLGEHAPHLTKEMCLQLVNAALALKGGEPINA